MRRLQSTVPVLAAVALACLASIAPASADPYDYPWCAQGPSFGYPGQCMYQTYAHCQASISGQYLACGENPRFLFREQAQPRQPQRRYRRIDHD
ncbi:DUF3551 domain-containing protein [Bradyrhizobium jicamae]|uniref:DUF3551 domain-containing protein n=1 Tax=Bradyrhizobium jicamae TaxID=280332 RepID=UPI001BA547CF|nr:DUF3551 domain-containing protein [Bradyrhizobium jicamae]MBR0932178.1 DUF3551 domain-containing protein [Bradyrhizobium jicamae]